MYGVKKYGFLKKILKASVVILRWNSGEIPEKNLEALSDETHRVEFAEFFEKILIDVLEKPLEDFFGEILWSYCGWNKVEINGFLEKNPDFCNYSEINLCGFSWKNNLLKTLKDLPQ